MAHVFVIDNYDSFTYNLVQLLGSIGAVVTVARNDRVTLDEIAAAAPTHLLVSPGPCTPAQAGISTAAIVRFAREIPVLGVCLRPPVHRRGVRGSGQPRGRPRARQDRRGAPRRARSLAVACRTRSPPPAITLSSLTRTSPLDLELTAWTAEGVVMGVRHQEALRRGRAVPPRERPHRSRCRPHAQLPRHDPRRDDEGGRPCPMTRSPSPSPLWPPAKT